MFVRTTLAISSLALVSGLASMGITGCAAGASAIPEGAHVQALRGERTVLHGTAENAKASPTCDPVAAADAKHLVELGDDTLVTVSLRGAVEGERMPGAVLHMTHLASKRTWCVGTDRDGVTAEVGGELPGGIYALAVTIPNANATTSSYDIVWRKL